MISEPDHEAINLLRRELERQRTTLCMIPSENYASEQVMRFAGSVPTNKYSEGMAGARYYGGNEVIDDIERLAQERARQLFGVSHANVQPYSGSPANLAVYTAVCEPGDVTMGMALPDGGHLTHGWKVSITGKHFRPILYHVRPDGYIDMDEVERLAKEHKPKLIWCGATAYSREIPFEEFGRIAHEVKAYLAADIAHIAGLIAAGVHPSPVEYVDIVTTTTHKTLRGPRGAMIMVTHKGLRDDPELAKKIDSAVFPGLQGGPHNSTTLAIAAALYEASQPEFREYGAQIVGNAKALAAELVAQGMQVVTGGTDNHLLLVRLQDGGGAFAQYALEDAGIICNKNAVPSEPVSMFYPSGIRLGTPALTTRGMKEPEMHTIAKWISRVVQETASYRLPADSKERSSAVARFRAEIAANPTIQDVKRAVLELCGRFPLYPGLEY